ncbi:hypothetical protein AVEN_68667-1 [Araneus ventricosus]|uniref:Uncharacterized protein n=1 Tax=Araneus ventricosus TaxID=182803 RepID=A0A4Y2QLH2_ARAVE|nr:hypothetical protein AVEN_68667-1 [Araneus ventricosus]
MNEWEEIQHTIVYLPMRNIDIGNTEILFNQFVYLKDYLEKNNTKKMNEWEEMEHTIEYLSITNIDIGNTEIPFNQFVYLKDSLEKNNTNQKCDATMKLSMEEKWLKIFCRYIGQKSYLIKLCEYVFANSQCKCGVNIFFNVHSMVGRKKQIAIGGN